ncbi:hypothetical protein [Candidatus Microthrix parvicella]|uniref:hypothetical protein n=1 Tax=Candidatus Neomicrothrix parvicella TaxID=41950 RepID=UPI0003776B00|nr:hypothetical protein [Candidatus Microthrix parvicella]
MRRSDPVLAVRVVEEEMPALATLAAMVATLGRRTEARAVAAEVVVPVVVAAAVLAVVKGDHPS